MAVIAAIVVTVAAGALQADTQMKAAEAQKIELEQQAEQEKFASRDRELERRRRTNRALAQNIVGQAASGISGEGTPASLGLSAARQASLTEGGAGLSQRLRERMLQQQGRTAVSLGRQQAAVTLLDTAASAYKAGA